MEKLIYSSRSGLQLGSKLSHLSFVRFDTIVWTSGSGEHLMGK